MAQQPSHPHEASLGHTYVIGVLEADLHLPQCQSLKEKRGRLAKVLNHLRKLHPVIVAEVGDQNVWGRAGIAAVTLSADRELAGRILDAAAQTLAHDRDIELVWHEIQFV